MRTRRRRRPPIIMAGMLLLAASLIPLPAPANADATTDELVGATFDELGVDLAPDDVVTELAALLERFVDAGAIAPEVLEALADSDDPAIIGPVLAQHLAQERLRWSEVGPAWAQARLMLGERLGECPLDEESTCGLLLRTRLQTEASLRLAEAGECDADCAQRLDRVRERLERTIRQVEQLGTGPDADVAQLLRDAEQARLRLQERIRVAREAAQGPGPTTGPNTAPDPQGPRPDTTSNRGGAA